MKWLAKAALVTCLVLVFPACTKKSSEDMQDPVEGASTAANEKAAENPPDEMQQKEKKDEAPAPSSDAAASPEAAPAGAPATP